MKWLCLFAALAAFFVTNLHAREAWVTLTDCQYVANDSNDGDSFHVKAGDKEYTFRLYFVDAPEISTENPTRLVEQAKYFGITVPQVIELGRSAHSYVRDQLAEPFTVITRFANAMGRGKAERFSAFVRTKDGDLGEEMVAKGLARIYGRSVKPPGHSSSTAEAEKLAQLENEAKEKQVGGWGGKREQKSQENNPSKSVSSDSKEEMESRTASPPGLSLPPTTAAATPHKLDVNHATRKQLEDLPGIGPVLAEHIIAARPLKSADDLLHVDGIGRKKYAAIRPFFD